MKIEKTSEGVSMNLSNEEFERIREEMVSKGLMEKKDKGLPKVGDCYWLLDSVGTEVWTFDNDVFENGAISRGNFYLTEEEAKKADERRLALGRIQKFIRENDIDAPCTGYIPDFSDGGYKYQITGWNYTYDEVSLNSYIKFDESQYNLIFKTLEGRQAVLENCSKDLEILLKVY